MRLLPLLLLCCAPALPAEDEGGLDQPLTSFRAKQLREEGAKHWAASAAAREQLAAKQAVDPANAAAALDAVELALARLEQALELEWDAAANKVAADAARAWFALRPLAPAPPEREAAKRRARRVADVRRFALEHGAARRFESLFQRCTRCDGRGVMPPAFQGKPPPCPACRQQGRLPVRKGILAARWFSHSPVYRDDASNARTVDRELRVAANDPTQLGPFVKSLAVDGEVEDHDTWARVTVREKLAREPGEKPEERKTVLTVFRVGDRWYLWERRFDDALVAIPQEGGGGA